MYFISSILSFLERKKSSIAKYGFSLLLLAYLFTFHIQIEQFEQTIRNIKLQYYVLGYLFGIAGIAFSVVRWWYILRYNGERVPIRTLFELYFVGVFYNMLLPGSLGGDVVRAYKTTTVGEDGNKLAVSVPLERLTGLVALLLVGTFSLVGIYNSIPSRTAKQLLGAVALMTSVLVAVSSSIVAREVNKLLQMQPFQLGRIRPLIDQMMESARDLRDFRFLLPTLLLSILFIVASLGATYNVGRALGVELPLLYLAAVIPIIRLAVQLPISIGGFGVREGLYVYFFTQIGVSVESAVAIGVVGITLTYINAVLGGLLNLKTSI